jgi:hypothetical protein
MVMHRGCKRNRDLLHVVLSVVWKKVLGDPRLPEKAAKPVKSPEQADRPDEKSVRLRVTLAGRKAAIGTLGASSQAPNSV